MGLQAAKQHELPPDHPFAVHEYTELPDYSLRVLQKEFENRDLELLYKRYEQRAQIGERQATKLEYFKNFPSSNAVPFSFFLSLLA